MMSAYDYVMRTIVEIPEEQLAELAEICRREGISRAEAIRRAVGIYTRRQVGEGSRNAFGIWKKRAVDGLDFEDRVRSEWARRDDS